MENIAPRPNLYLPPAPPDLGPAHTRQHRDKLDGDFHFACLELSQSLWLQKKPAQAILQLNKAAMVPESSAPYPALVCYLINPLPGLFIGNPVRHFQHLATRVSGIHAELRSWRAWACFHLAEAILCPADYPRDQLQIEKEGLQIPSAHEVEKKLPSSDSSSLPVAKALARTHLVTRS